MRRGGDDSGWAKGYKDGDARYRAVGKALEGGGGGGGGDDSLDGLKAAEDVKLGASRLRGAPMLGANLHEHLQLFTVSRNTTGHVS